MFVVDRNIIFSLLVLHQLRFHQYNLNDDQTPQDFLCIHFLPYSLLLIAFLSCMWWWCSNWKATTSLLYRWIVIVFAKNARKILWSMYFRTETPTLTALMCLTTRIFVTSDCRKDNTNNKLYYIVVKCTNKNANAHAQRTTFWHNNKQPRLTKKQKEKQRSQKKKKQSSSTSEQREHTQLSEPMPECECMNAAGAVVIFFCHRPYIFLFGWAPFFPSGATVTYTGQTARFATKINHQQRNNSKKHTPSCTPTTTPTTTTTTHKSKTRKLIHFVLWLSCLS